MITVQLDEQELQLFTTHFDNIKSALVALAGVIDDPGDVRDMCLRTALGTADALQHLGEIWGLYAEETGDPEPQKSPSDDPEDCGHPLLFPDLIALGTRMCESCGATEVEPGVWKVL